MKISKGEGWFIKGVAVLLMLMHHQWGFPETMTEVHIPHALQALGESGKICVSMFLFMSGYGLQKVYRERKCTFADVGKRILKTYQGVWKVFFVCMPIFIFAGMQRFNALECLLNAICVMQTYNHTWWFILLYVEFLVCLPLIANGGDRKFIAIMIILSLVTRGLGYMYEGRVFGNPRWIYAYTVYFLMGCFFARECSKKVNILALMEKKMGIKMSVGVRLAIVGAACCLLFAARRATGWTGITICITPLFVLMLHYAFQLLKCTALREIGVALGKHSMNMWLIHAFFCFFYLQKWFFSITVNPYLLLLLLIVISFGCSVVVNRFWRCVSIAVKLLCEKNKILRAVR